MDWETDAVFKVLRDAGYSFIEADYNDTDEEGVESYTVYVRNNHVTED